jgi:hypothetical protein
MVGLLVIGFIANLLIRPVASKWHEPKATSPATARADTERSAVR